MKRLLYIALAISTGLTSFAPGLAAAATVATAAPAASTTNQSFQISPPTSTYAADPGTNVTGTIKVTNLTDTALVLQIGKENFVAKGEEGEVELTDNADPLYSLAPWFNLGTASQITVPGRATTAFAYTIDVPANAEPGGRYGSITFNTIAAKLPSGQSGAGVEQQIAAIVFLRINGQANEKLSIASFGTNKSFYEYAPIVFNTRVKNDGDVHEKPTGTITIKNMLGITTATIPLDEHYVIPGAVRHLQNTWPSNGKRKLLFGHYTAHLSATYANGKALTGTVSFWVIPYKLIAVILLIIIVVFFVFWRGRKRLGRAFRILAGKE